MSKSLSEMLDNFQVKITQIRALENEAYVDRESFLKMKRVAIELAETLTSISISLFWSNEELKEVTLQDVLLHYSQKIKAAENSIARAKDIIGGE